MTKKIFLFGALILFLAYVKTHGASFNMVQVGSTNNPGRITSSTVLITNNNVYAGAYYGNPIAALTNLANLGVINSLYFGPSNQIGYLKPIIPGQFSVLTDYGTNLVIGVSNINLASGSAYINGILPPSNMGTGTLNGNTFLNGTGAFVAVTASANVAAIPPLFNTLANGTNTFTIGTNGNASTFLDGTGAFSTPTLSGVPFLASNNTYSGSTTQAMFYVTQNGLAVLDQTNIVNSISGKSFNEIHYNVGAQNIGSPGSSSNATLSLATVFRTVTVTNTPANINAISSSPGAGLARTDLICGTNNATITFSGAQFRFQYGNKPAILNQLNDTNIFFWANMGSSGPLINLATFYSRDPRSLTFPTAPINVIQTNSARMSQYKAIFNMVGAATGNAILEIRNDSNQTLDRASVNATVNDSDRSLSAIIPPNGIFVLTNLSTGTGTSITLTTNVLQEVTIN